MDKKFNIRVYGILINDKDEVLISDESRNGFSFTKFPGGGLEWGEGTIDCLKREFMEELNLHIEVNDLYYCTDFFQQSAFNDKDQLISIYYKVDYSDKNSLKFAKSEMSTIKDHETFRWISRTEINEKVFTFPIDKIVAGLISQA